MVMIRRGQDRVERFTDQLEDLFLSDDRTFARRYLQILLDKVVVDGKIIHVHAKAASVAQIAATKKQKADEELTASALVPTSEQSWLLLRDLNPRPSG